MADGVVDGGLFKFSGQVSPISEKSKNLREREKEFEGFREFGSLYLGLSQFGSVLKYWVFLSIWVVLEDWAWGLNLFRFRVSGLKGLGCLGS